MKILKAPASARRRREPSSSLTILLLAVLIVLSVSVPTIAQTPQDPVDAQPPASTVDPSQADEAPADEAPADAQELADEEPDAESAASTPAPAGSARLVVDRQQVEALAFTLRSDGPRFAISPLARALGAELQVGPLGESHTLIVRDKSFLFGPGDRTVVTLADTPKPHIWYLRAAPIRGASGLQVPLELLQRTLGEELGYEFVWSFRELELSIDRQRLRQLSGTISLNHQHRTSTLEITFSAAPRYRFEQLDGAVVVHLIGDSLVLSEPFSRPADPLVTDLILQPTQLRVELAPNSQAFEPRLVPQDQGVSMVIDIFRALRRSVDPDTSTAERPPFPRLEEGIRTIVIDPGHGGPDEAGAVGKNGTIESELTLMMARLLRTRLMQRLPVDVVLTRDRDTDVPHATRVAIANENKADLFISLHFNSYPGSTARGAETYFLSREASDQLAANLAAKENRTARTAGGERQDLELILWDLAQSYHLTESQRFASLVQEELNQALGLRDRGVRQAPFVVLMGTTMPAVLVELGFLSNEDEEAKLRSSAYRTELADALVRAVVRFKTQLEARASSPRDQVPGTSSGTSGATP